MQDTSQHITNRYGLQLFIRTFIQKQPKGLVFLAHGMSDNHATPNMLNLRRAFLALGYSIVVWDATNSSWGQSEGRYEDATFTRHYDDLEDVVAWARRKPWFAEPFTMGGYSLGGIAAGTFAARHSQTVDRLILLAPIVSGRYLVRAIPWPIRLVWRVKGTLTISRKSQKRYSYAFIRDGLNYDLINLADHLSMPVLIIGAGRDIYVRTPTLRQLAAAIPHSNKQIIIHPKAGHRFLNHQDKVREAIQRWISNK